MKTFTAVIFLSFFGVNICGAQDSTITLTPGMYKGNVEQIIISGMDGWVFKPGNDTAWKQKDISLNGWEKLRPDQLSAKYADKGGRAEGWFRIKIKLDSSFKSNLVNFRIITWAASDVYVNGDHLFSFGNTGYNGEPFNEYRSTKTPLANINFIPGNEYTIALHMVDFISPFPPRRLKSETDFRVNTIRLSGPSYYAYYLSDMRLLSIYTTIWVAVCAVLCLLFWLLAIQNPNEKNLKLIAIATTCSLLTVFFNTIQDNYGLSFLWYTIYGYVGSTSGNLLCVFTVLILVNIFKRVVTRRLKIILISFFVFTSVTVFFPDKLASLIFIPSLSVLLVISLYYIVSAWKNLRGAQWAIVAGLIFSFVCILAYVLNSILSPGDITFFYLSVTCFSLALPLSLLVYVSMRFKEIINEVQKNAKQVVLLSKEKEIQALNQQQILQEEVNKQTAELRTTLDNLKFTQSQLIQSEKLASLGELTAGIAHEIQNPLNFVNNFSDINKELLGEMDEEIQKGNYDEVKTIAGNIADNEEKISHHGRRADAIVKGMLQHSRTNTGQKELTDINALADEYLRLSYQGLRAKDRTFNAVLQTDFDPNVGSVNMIPQDIGRVLLNLYNNAFYAVSEKKKQQKENYEPTVSVSTKRIGEKIEIRVTDNGTGIPQLAWDKIFQPFFTTKPAGQGTGLGLSISHDIIRSHGGEIKADSKENEGTTFIIQIPVITT
jgi:two-component system, NtrC family, sensor kinase